jgi:hypothetical protein
MRNVSQKIQQFFFSNTFQVAITFLISGLLAGALFSWITNLPALESFFYEPYFFPFDNTMQRGFRFSWYVASSLIFALGLIAAFLVFLQRGEFVRPLRLTKLRSLSAFVIVAGTIPSSYLIYELLGNMTSDGWLLVPLVLILPLAHISLAMCLLTRSLLLLPVAFLISLLLTISTFGIKSLIFPLAAVLDSVGMAILFSSLSLVFGLWLSWRAVREKQKGA